MYSYAKSLRSIRQGFSFCSSSTAPLIWLSSLSHQFHRCRRDLVTCSPTALLNPVFFLFRVFFFFDIILAFRLLYTPICLCLHTYSIHQLFLPSSTCIFLPLILTNRTVDILLCLLFGHLIRTTLLLISVLRRFCMAPLRVSSMAVIRASIVAGIKKQTLTGIFDLNF